MAQEMFDTTQIKKLYPGLNVQKGVVNKSGLIDDSMLTSVAGGIALGIDKITALDEKLVLEKADERAQALSDEYLNNAPVETAFLQERKMQINEDLGGAVGDDREHLLEELDLVTTRLSNAKLQGLMTPFEFNRRVNLEAEEIARVNPHLKDKIIARVNKTVGDSAVQDVMQQQVKLAELQSKREADEYAFKIETIKDYYPGSPYDLSPNQLDKVFYEIQSDKAMMNEIMRVADMQDVNGYKEFMRTGGPSTWQRITYNELTGRIRAIAKNKELYPTHEQQLSAGLDVIQEFKNTYEDLLSDLHQERTEIKRFITQMDKLFESAEKQMRDDFSLEGINKFVANKAAIYKNSIEIEGYQQYGTTLALEEALDKRMSRIKKYQELGLIDQEQERIALKSVATLSKQAAGNRGIYVPPELQDEMNTPGFTQMIADEVKDVNAESQPGDVNTITNYIGFINDKDPTINTVSKVKQYDVVLTSLGRLDQESFNRLNKDPVFQATTVEALKQYKEFTNTALQQLTIGQDIDITLIEETGQLVTSNDNTKIAGILQRINTYIRIRANLLGKKPSEIAKDILKSDFNDFKYAD